jgi:hypothetical protein
MSIDLGTSLLNFDYSPSWNTPFSYRNVQFNQTDPNDITDAPPLKWAALFSAGDPTGTGSNSLFVSNTRSAEQILAALQAIWNLILNKRPDDHPPVGGARGKQSLFASRDPSDIDAPLPPARTGGTPMASNHQLNKQFEVQKGAGDDVRIVKDPLGRRGDVVKVDFRQGRYTTHSTSPRAEIKDNTPLQEGKPYHFHVGMLREKNTDTTFFQVLDHNGSKPSPRAWLGTKDGNYILHLKTGSGANAGSQTYNLGPAGKDVGKWADIDVNYKRGVNNGSISVNINGKQVFSKSNISTMFDTHSGNSYAKFGQYRNEGDRSPGTIYFSDFSINGN